MSKALRKSVNMVPTRSPHCRYFDKTLQNCSLSGPLPNISFLLKGLNLIGCYGNRKAKFAKNIFKNQLRSHEGDKADTLQNYS